MAGDADKTWEARLRGSKPDKQPTLLIFEDDIPRLDTYKQEAEKRGWRVITALAYDPDLEGGAKLPQEIASKYTYVAASMRDVRNILHAHCSPPSDVPIDAVLSDYQLGICKGNDVVRAAKSISSTYNHAIPVIGHSSDLNDDISDPEAGKRVRDAFVLAGADATLAKAFYKNPTDRDRTDNAEERHKTLDALVAQYEVKRAEITR